MSVAQQNVAGQITYEDLYERWEQGNWKATEVDFSADRTGWDSLSDVQRRSALWIYSMFFYGEDAVTDGLSPYIDAAPTEEQTYFLATQQVDEARHAVFFHRFFKEVIGAGGDDASIGSTLAFTHDQLGWGYRGVFERLERTVTELKADQSLPMFARAITMYHMIVEGTLAQPGQHYIEDFFAKAGTMPGFSSGMENVSRDEQRHIAFGVKTLAELFADPDQGEDCKAAVVELLREVMPYSLAVFVPPGFDREYTRSFGFELEDIYTFGLRLVKSRWRATGYPIEEMPNDVFPFDPDLPESEVVARQVKLLKAGITGEPRPDGVAPDCSPEIQEVYFNLVARSADTEVVNGRPLTVQWRFSDADPWHVRIDNGSTAAVPGLAEKADVTLDTTWTDWINISLRGEDARKAMLKRKLRPHGSLRGLRQMQKVFPQREPLL